MSSELEQSELLKKADDAWIEFERWSNEVIAPRSYKEKQGRKKVFINPWKDLAERTTAEQKQHELYEEWLHVFQKYIAMTGERPYLPILYVAQETINGIRYVKAPQKV